MGKEEFLKINKVSKSFGSNKVLNNLELSIPQKGIFGIMGLSGCGKTTLLNLLINYWKPDSGSIEYNGINISKNQRVMKQMFGFASQTGSVYKKLTVEENLIHFGRLYNMNRKNLAERIPELLKFIDMADSKDLTVEQLSTGMFRRLDIACSMIHKPRVLILDEPTSNMDPVLRKKILALIKKIDDEGTKIIMTSHLLDEAERICDDLAILHHGKIIADGSPDQLKDRYSRNKEIKFSTEKGDYKKIIPGLKKMGIRSIYERYGHLYLYTTYSDRLLQSILTLVRNKGDKIRDIEVTKPHIEEVFEALTKK
tara:strand:- start:2451 stop:3383 length:933 start_codon:yes stop_codon:yes gene_type:complete